MNRIITFTFISISLLTLKTEAQEFTNYKNLKYNYIQLHGELFENVQLNEIYNDSKTFVDVIPLKDPNTISLLFDSIKNKPDFNLEQFIFANFELPKQNIQNYKFADQNIDEHIFDLWEYLERKPGNIDSNSTLIPLSYNYIIPGGRFREIYYWDSFFTMLGLLADNKIDLAINMVSNFAYMLSEYKMIPNGNRIYYLTRSQPPFFALMIDAICNYRNDDSWGIQFIDELETEYNFWMNGENEISTNNKSSEHIVLIDDSITLNRYYDFDDTPREESFKEDYNLAQKLPDSLRKEFYRNIRAAAESGWDFSSRWFEDNNSILTINTTDILPVDLNCLLYFLEERISYYSNLKGDSAKFKYYQNRSLKRKSIINNLFWSEENHFYMDYNWKKDRLSNSINLAGIFPLYFGIAPENYALKVKNTLESKFLKPGGIITTLIFSGEQWDAPNGWAPLHWITIKALIEYNHASLATKIGERWLKLNESVFYRTNKMFEKYNVENLDLFAAGGEYDLQDGFGWTNGVYRAIKKLLNRY